MDEYHFPADKQTYKTKHKQTNKQKIMQYTQNISYLIRIKRPNHVKKIVMKDFIIKFRILCNILPAKTNLFTFLSFSFFFLWSCFFDSDDFLLISATNQ